MPCTPAESHHRHCVSRACLCFLHSSRRPFVVPLPAHCYRRSCILDLKHTLYDGLGGWTTIRKGTLDPYRNPLLVDPGFLEFPSTDRKSIQNLAYFVRTHERAFANALQSQRPKTSHGREQAVAGAYSSSLPATTTSLSSSLAEALSRPFSSPKLKPSKLTLTPHHLYFLLDKFASELSVDVGPLNVRLESLQGDVSNYISFLGRPPLPGAHRSSDADSLRSVSSVRSVMSSMSSVWSTITLSNSTAKAEKQLREYRDDLKYLYSCFTKIPALRLSPDHRARLIKGYEQFPFDTAVPLFVFKNVSSLEICDLDFRQFHGWDRLSEQLRSLTLRRAGLDDPIDVLQNIILDDAQKRRDLASKAQVPTTPSTPGAPWPTRPSPIPHQYFGVGHSMQYPGDRRKSVGNPYALGLTDGTPPRARQSSNSPPRPMTSRQTSTQRPPPSRTGTPRNVPRRSSGSSGSSHHEMTPRHSTSDLLAMGILPPSKWRFLRHLSLAENGLTSLSVSSLAPVASTLQSLDLSSNLFSEIPDALGSLTHLRALNLSNCMIDSLSSLAKSPLPAITTLNLRANRLLSLYGIERLYSLERIDLRDNRLHDPTELKRLTGIDIADLYVIKNPFTRTHSNYRITIFNLFRMSPGHTDDVTIDTMAPLYHEKKHLVDRVPEPANKPVIKPPPEDEGPADVHVTADAVVPAVASQEASSRGHRRTTSDMGPGSTVRRKKLPRRRVVELAQAEHRVVKPSEDIFVEPPVPDLTELPPMPHTPTTESDQPSTPEATSYHTTPTTQHETRPGLAVRPKLDTSFTSPTPPIPKIRDSSDDDNSPLRPLEDVGSNTDVYRQKIEALKHELGPNWLSALNEERFASARARERSFSPASRTTVRPDQPPRGVSVGGRTLG